MTPKDRDQTPADLAWVAERLEQERPTAGPLELDRMKLQVRSQARRGARSQAKGNLLKSRVAITAILMLGLVTGGTGTTLALEGDGQGSAAQVQYPREGGGNVLGEQRGGGGGENGPGGESADVLGATEASPGVGGAVQGSQQVAAADSGDSLPFTGLAAVPLILLGVALLGAGAMLYRSARRAPSAA